MQNAQARVFSYEQFAGAARTPLRPEYRPRQPDKSLLHQLVQQHLETMLAEARAKTEHGFGYPGHVEKAFRNYHACGRLELGFARVRCKSCGFERLLGFSCRSRICPSCHARRMHDIAFHLTDNILPRVPYRMWVLTLPRPIRLLMLRDKTVLSKVLNIYIRALFSFQRKVGRNDGFGRCLPGSVTFTQLFGGALNAYSPA
jgi:predicted Zn-ribbon and HTH transcriptional regulator